MRFNAVSAIIHKAILIIVYAADIERITIPINIIVIIVLTICFRQILIICIPLNSLELSLRYILLSRRI